MTARKRRVATEEQPQEEGATDDAPKATAKQKNPYAPGTAASEAWIKYPWTRKGAQAPEE